MPDTIKVSFKLFGVAHPGRSSHWETAVSAVPVGSTVGQVLPSLGIHHEAHVSVLVGGRIIGWDYALQEGEEVVVIPPLAGG